ncbi:hypothetical protein ACFL96_13575 [Thermoproteota archaeon]
MAFVGFEFNKINVAKNSKVKGKITINNHVAINDVSKAELKMSGGENAIRFDFEYTSEYGKLGNIALGGSVLYLSTQTEVKAILAEWAKDKKVKKELMNNLLNRILAKCNIQSVILSDTVNLPPPVRLPKVQIR